jgi:membrane-associated protease RseP (regulator of RpoE activity)
VGPPDVERLVLDAFGRDGFARGGVGRDVLERARAGDAPWVTYLRALPPLPPSTWATYGPAALAGAQLVALDDDLRDAVTGAPPRGVFVLKVLPGTPAAEAGLRAGDVITGAAGRPVHTPAALQRALASRAAGVRRKAERPADGAPRPDDRTVTLRVARGGAARDVVLRW